MNELLARVIEAHGGLAQWQRYEKVEADIVSGGGFFALKGLMQDAAPRRMSVWLKEQRSSVLPFGAARPAEPVHRRPDRHRETRRHRRRRAFRAPRQLCRPSDAHALGSAAPRLFQRRRRCGLISLRRSCCSWTACASRRLSRGRKRMARHGACCARGSPAGSRRHSGVQEFLLRRALPAVPSDYQVNSPAASAPRSLSPTMSSPAASWCRRSAAPMCAGPTGGQ